ncbi:Glycoside hydrolase, family 28, partial [Cynara cardunculus var. scolymus]
LVGKITAPKTLAGWKNCTSKEYWIYLSSVKGLTIVGPGQFDGQGSLWWGNDEALHFHDCNGLRLKGTTHINSPKLHISINGCKDVDIRGVRILAPKDSPNTDGIDISDSTHVNIHHSNIQTGDDCVAINGGVYDVNVTRVFCGPGHGISIGSLGEHGSHDTVEKVRVENCNISGTQNGLRIKTVPYGTGYARGIVFRKIHLVNVENPIIIDQHYCANTENAICPSPPSAPAVQVSDVRYENIYGSSATTQAITFSCSGKYKCTGIQTNGVRITGHNDFAFCKNAQGRFIDTTPHLLGNISAPKTLAGWKDCISSVFWIHFSMVKGLTIHGPGQIDGQGSLWWGKAKALHFNACNGLRLRGTSHVNSPRLHISIHGCQDVDIGNVLILAPGNSPNTDGIDIGHSSHSYIGFDTQLNSVAVNGGVYDANVTRVFCGPGHGIGISIGSLGENRGRDIVEKVRVEDCNITGTTNGLRIKTVPYGRGYARGIIFRNINLINVKRPIIIDQHYCSNSNSEYAACRSPPSAPAIQVSDVRYENIYGSSATQRAIIFSCSKKYKCIGIQTNRVVITGNNVFVVCKNVEGNFVDTTTPDTC